jgi:hypothetical protein
MPKKFFNIDTMGQLDKSFWHNIRCFQHIALSLDLGYSDRDINYAPKSFMKLTPMACFIKLFPAKLMPLSAYCIKFWLRLHQLCQKGFMKLTPDVFCARLKIREKHLDFKIRKSKHSKWHILKYTNSRFEWKTTF